MGGVFLALTTWAVSRFRPMLWPGISAYRDIFRFSRNLFGSKCITYLRENIDNAVVGTLGTASLGQYKFGEDQSMGAVISVGGMVAQISLPALATVQRQTQRFRQIYLDMLRLTATFSTPMQLGAFVLADIGIGLIFGEQWLEAIPVFRAYLIFRLFDAVFKVTDAATSAVGRPDIRFKVDLAQLPFFALGIWFGLRVWGDIVGVAWSLSLVRTTAGIVYFLVAGRATHLKRGDARRYLWQSSFAGIMMAGTVALVRSASFFRGWQTSLPDSIGAGSLALLILISFGVGIYFTYLFLLDQAAFITVGRQVLEIIKPRTSISNHSQFPPRT
jgi:teichuronic acid exporter